MIKFCLDQWNKNRDRLQNVIEQDTNLCSCDYEYLVKLLVEHVLNQPDPVYGYDVYDSERIATIDNGDYQGTLLFLIPRNTYQPNEYEYLMTYVWYGSCCGCDTLQGIQFAGHCDEIPDEQQVKDYMSLCKDLITHMICPYNSGWGHDEKFDAIVMDRNME